jgi:hypothetical protein
LVDPAEPDALRGAVEPVPEGETQPFVNERELVVLLHRLISSIEKLRPLEKQQTGRGGSEKSS